MKLIENSEIEKLKIGEEGINIEFEIYRDDSDDEESRSLYISHDSSSGCEYHGLTTAEDIARCIAEYIEFNM